MARAPMAFGRMGMGTIRWVRQCSIPDQIQREIVAVLALCAAGLLTLSSIGYAGKMTVLGVIGSGLSWLAGRGAIIAPIALVWIAIEILSETEVAARRRRLIGLVFFTTSIVTFLDLIFIPEGRSAGGEIGRILGNGARFVAGDMGSGIVCFAFGIVGVYLITGVHSRDVLDTWRGWKEARRA
ncbi:MAG TPA: DNA translocase FtsK 4TM domain-containing protein, partial [Nitrolancea sp.]|nr:DNA translocase FtsK 4TM domain-containing protein [Nitrolancea sp.]